MQNMDLTALRCHTECVAEYLLSMSDKSTAARTRLMTATSSLPTWEGGTQTTLVSA